ncbi:unnamed protein product [Ambrosiozyma monospora]|uniref:Unnamed protein product n=1 Tax=Ambrosiozyma monospora TaxID=43982 RepID=A0ACB5SZN1_AMBMO|nr:unnamed protein product [Ambrosiozyma monospora]
MARRGGSRHSNPTANQHTKNNKSKSRNKKKSKKSTQSRVQDAFQIASKQTGSDSETEFDSYFNSKSHKKKNSAILNIRSKIEGGNEDEESDDDFDDEELDSDEALTSDDDYDVLNSKFSQSLRDRGENGTNYDADDWEGGYDSVDEDELIPLSEVWDRDDNDLKHSIGGSSSNTSSKKNVEEDIVLNDDDDSDSESDSESESDSDDDDSSDDEEDKDDEDPFDEIESDSDIENEGAELDHVLANINSKLPKSALQKEKKHLINDKAEENLFGLSTSGKKLSLADMMKDMDEETNSEAILLPKSDANSNADEDADDDEEDRENKAFSVPLPQSIQQRKERKAAYDIQKEEVTKWKDTILRNRQAEVLNFQSKKASAKHNSTLFKPITTPLNKLDSQLDSILDASNIESKKTEDLFDDIDQAKRFQEIEED